MEIIDCSDSSNILATGVANYSYYIGSSPLIIPVTPWTVAYSLCGDLNYSAIFTQTSSIIFNSIDLTFTVETDDASLKGMTDSIILNGILSSGAQQTILFNVDFNMMANIGPPYFSEFIDSLVA